jgi:hypothetical protein
MAPYLLLKPRPKYGKGDMEYLAKFCPNTDKSELPLRLALFLSPLYLLQNDLVYKKKGRADIFEIIEVGFRPPSSVHLN